MEPGIEIALLVSQEQQRKNVNARNCVRRVQRDRDELLLIQQYQSSSVQDSTYRMEGKVERKEELRSINEERSCVQSDYGVVLNDTMNMESDMSEQHNENDCQMEWLMHIPEDYMEIYTAGFEDSDGFDTRNALTIPTTIPLHYFTNVLTHEYCQDLLKILRSANICKSQSNELISLVKSALPEPNNMPSSMRELLSMMNIEDLFTKRRVCILCKCELSSNQNFCTKCQSTDRTKFASVYDIDLTKTLSLLIERLSIFIEEYKQKIIDHNDVETTNDIPFGIAYQELLKEK